VAPRRPSGRDPVGGSLAVKSAPRLPSEIPRLVVEPVYQLDTLEEEWSALGERTGNVFATWDWNSTWWRHLGSGRRLLAAACRDEAGALIGLLPTYVAKAAGPARVIRLLGHGQGDHLGPICMPADRPRVSSALRMALRAKPWNNAVILAEQLPADERWSQLLGARTIVREASPVLELTTRNWDEFLAERRSSLRKQVLYQERRLTRERDMRYRLIDEAEALPGAMDTLFRLHGARWGREGTAAYGAAQSFHRAFAARAQERGWLRLWLLELDGRAVAAWHGFRFGGADWHYQSGRDPSWDRYSVGAVLLAHTIRDCIEAGMHRYLFLRGNEPYKLRFATSDPGLETMALGTGVVGRAGLAAATGARRMPTAIRRRIARVLRT
jgi:CelD/BcsL family acetyltransferase involved in cellulose biosynthesis